MSTINFLRQLLADGVDLDMALLVAAKFEESAEQEHAKLIATLMDRLGEDKAASRKRHADAARMRSKREAERQSRDIARHRATAATSNDIGDASSCARVEDNLPRLVISGYQTTPDSAGEADLDWPETDKPSRAYLDKLESALRQACGAALASEAIAPRVRVLAPILALGRPGKGPACDLQADVLPTIRARSARAPPGSIRSWDFFRDAITEARDRRLAGAPAQEPINERPNHLSAATNTRAARRGVWAEVLAEERGEGPSRSAGARGGGP